MHLVYEDVNDAFRNMVTMLQLSIPSGHGMLRWPLRQEASRNGKVYVVDEPVLITYKKPRQRVLSCPGRDANPFFHLYESLWMLAGRNDLASLAFYASQMNEYSDNGKTLNGAYGYRWRNHSNVDDSGKYGGRYFLEKVDQLSVLVDHLKAYPNSRRAVLQMWNVEDDLMKVGGPCNCGADRTGPSAEGCMNWCQSKASKDVCCNLSVMFSLRESKNAANLSALDISQSEKVRRWGQTAYVLDMTVTNRSNDMIWGLLGANYVHFTFLQEYMACALGVEVGLYHHFTNNLHVYDWNWKPAEWLNGWEQEPYPKLGPVLADEDGQFNLEVHTVVDHFNGTIRRPNPTIDYVVSPFLRKVAALALRAFELHKTYKETEQAIRMCQLIEAEDWRLACTEWLERRLKKQEAK